MNYPAPPAQPSYPQYPGYPAPAPQAAPPAPPQQYAPAAYPQPGYAPAPQAYAPPAPAAPPLATGTLDDFYNQPSTGGGPSLKFEQIGTRYIGTVARALGAGDVQQQTDTMGRPLFFRDGRPKWVMKVPLLINHPSFPDGTAQWYVKGAARDELNRAMAEAGSSAQAPEPGATLDITFVSTRASGQGMNPAKVFRVVYTPPGVAPAPAPAATAPQQPAPVQPQQQFAPVPQQVQAPAQPQFQAPAQPQFQAPQAAPVQPVTPQAAPPAAMAPPAAQPNGMTPEQQALFAQITGQQAPAQ